MAVDTRTPALLLLVAAAATGVYVFFQNAPEAKLYVLPAMRVVLAVRDHTALS